MTILIKSAEIYFLGIHHDIYKRAFDRRIDRLIRRGFPITDKRTNFMANKCYFLRERFENAAHSLDLIVQDKRI